MLDSVQGTEDKAMDKKNVPRALLANGKDTTCKILQIKSELLMREKIQCCCSIEQEDLTEGRLRSSEISDM